jgi:hypothetical protein
MEQFIMGIHERLDRLERRHRRLTMTLWSILAAVPIALLLGAAASADRTLEAERFVLKDADGHLRAELSVDRKTQLAGMHLFDRDGNPVVELSEYPAGSGYLLLTAGPPITEQDRRVPNEAIKLGGKDRHVVVYGAKDGQRVELVANDLSGRGVAVVLAKGKRVRTISPYTITP